ncbi:MAG: ATP-dependent Clp protease ATP-binding subunit [Oscillospiraceae bacterium]|nr:ATP-dependent Clp protease ATP-binding subunit [Oscillospiraceae bacterium]
MMCTRCKKRMAVVYLSYGDKNGQGSQALCLKCAKELNIQPFKDMMDKMGISDEELESMSEQMTEMIQEDSDGLFQPGGAMPMPMNFLQNLMGGNAQGGEQQPPKAPEGNEKKPKDKGKEPSQFKHLSTYCENLTAKAAAGKLDAIVGRDQEIYRVQQILCRRQKNNPCLIGEPGVGKTAIAEGIALRIASGAVPAQLRGKELYMLDLTALVAGTQFRGQFESRVKGLISDVKKAGNVILFIDEVHSLVGAGGDSEGSMNAANILKPALSRGEVQVIGATTFNEYRKHIEKDAALERRFQPVRVCEPTVEDSVAILQGIKKYYEKFHHVTVSDTMARRAVVLSERYIADRFLPDKAIDLLDEACACATLGNKAFGEYRLLLDQRDADSKQLKELEAETENPSYEKMAELRSTIARADQRLEELLPEAMECEVTEADLAKVIELWTGIPASKIQESELRRVASLEEALKKRIIGQDEAVELIASAVRRSRVQLTARRRPASFIFVGPTGVGKTELAKVLSREMFDDADPLIRLDMSEFMEKFSVSRIIGSPPGYVGYDEAGQLTEKVRRRPYSVVLFDEIEKAHPDVMNILLQILDEGRITDAQGRTVSFENTIIIMTSNAGSGIKGGGMGFNKTTGELEKDKVMKALGEFLRPEFLGRVDEIIVFRQLSVEDFGRIAALMLDETKAALEEKAIKFSYDDKALAAIAAKAHGNHSGARDLRRVIRKHVEDPLALLLVENPDAPPALVALSADEEQNLTLHTA